MGAKQIQRERESPSVTLDWAELFQILSLPGLGTVPVQSLAGSVNSGQPVWGCYLSQPAQHTGPILVFIARPHYWTRTPAIVAPLVH
jgi:hypothetical protein